MGDTVIKLTREEIIRMKVDVLDGNGEDALAMLKILLKRAEAASSPGMKSHLDR